MSSRSHQPPQRNIYCLSSKWYIVLRPIIYGYGCWLSPEQLLLEELNLLVLSVDDTHWANLSKGGQTDEELKNTCCTAFISNQYNPGDGVHRSQKTWFQWGIILTFGSRQILSGWTLLWRLAGFVSCFGGRGPIFQRKSQQYILKEQKWNYSNGQYLLNLAICVRVFNTIFA